MSSAHPAIARLDSRDADFNTRLDALLAWHDEERPEILATVSEVLARVRAEGDAALLEYTRRFDRMEVADVADLEIGPDAMRAAFEQLPEAERDALEAAAERIRDYHRRQVQRSWEYRDADGNLLGQKVTALDRAGVYVPGGKAAYPSSVLMNVIPAKVAGVGEVVLVAPSPGGDASPIVLAAAHVAGADRFFQIGGAQAVAALAWGTASVPRVDKIVGPGNVYVATAKRLVFGQVGIDMIAGPSEILVVCDGRTDPRWIAADLFSQAEHDEDAQSILVSPDAEFLDRVLDEMADLLPRMSRRDIIRASLEKRGALVQVRDLDEAAQLVNRVAPEHLELSVEEPEVLLESIRHAGAVFLGRHTPEALGDYCAGPNHVLPTSGTARFFSPLGVYDFQKRTSLIGCSPQGAANLAVIASALARGEGLEAHALSAEYRGSGDGKPS